MKTIAIVGAGPGIGLALAETFGAAGYQVALVARNREKLDGFVRDLEAKGIAAAGFAADVTAPEQIAATFAAIRERFGAIDVLEYSPIPTMAAIEDVLHISIDGLRHQFDLIALGAVASVREVLPEMLERGEGALLFTTGGSAQIPMPFLGGISLAMGGLHNYVTNLNTALTPKGIYVGTISIHAMVSPEGVVSPALVAKTYLDMVEKRDQFEVTLKDPALDFSAFLATAS
jgi:NAD(P)-dependent dehydrogenase (short-subunit alcohol dehydrogenase family)